MLERMLSRHAELAYSALRIVAGVMLLFHGAQKLFGLFGQPAVPTLSQLWIGAIIELVGGILVALGLFTRPAAFLISGMMAVAYFQFHWKLAMDERFLPLVNKGELAVLYCFVFLFIACRGPGRASLDTTVAKR